MKSSDSLKSGKYATALITALVSVGGGLVVVGVCTKCRDLFLNSVRGKVIITYSYGLILR